MLWGIASQVHQICRNSECWLLLRARLTEMLKQAQYKPMSIVDCSAQVWESSKMRALAIIAMPIAGCTSRFENPHVLSRTTNAQLWWLYICIQASTFSHPSLINLNYVSRKFLQAGSVFYIAALGCALSNNESISTVLAIIIVRFWEPRNSLSLNYDSEDVAAQHQIIRSILYGGCLFFYLLYIQTQEIVWYIVQSGKSGLQVQV